MGPELDGARASVPVLHCRRKMPGRHEPPASLPLPPQVASVTSFPGAEPGTALTVLLRLQVRYRPELDLVLHGLSFAIRGRDKVIQGGR